MVHDPRSNLVSEPCSMLVTTGSSTAAVMLSGTGLYVPSEDQKLSARPDSSVDLCSNGRALWTDRYDVPFET